PPMSAATLPSALRRPDSVALSDKPVWSLADASKATTLSIRTLQKLIADGRLKASKIGRRVLLNPDAVKTALLG
ncbi:MAG: excisionase family DNA-binding protein, partial [Planctomycetaceae bacterium]|nr:excisionase family DNA-binding protein [Planctomycetaceae bacterium]